MSDNSNLIEKALELTIHSGHLNQEFIQQFAKHVINVDKHDPNSEHVEAILLETLPDEIDDLVTDREHKPILERTFFHESEAEHLLNDKVIGRYKIDSILHSDYIGQWFSAQDINCEREIHVRFLKPKYDNDPKQLHRFTNEAKALAKLCHPGIPVIHEMNLTEGGAIYYTCNPLPRFNLKQLVLSNNVKHKQPLSQTQLLDIMISACNILAYAHKNGIYHQDIKPEHFLLHNQQRLIITGWSNATTQTHIRSALAGTPLYMAPEQARIECVDHRSDIYALGVSFYHLLTKQTLVSYQSLDDFWRQKRDGSYQEIPEAHLPKALANIIKRCVAPQADQRYQSASALASDLKDFQQSQQRLSSWSDANKSTEKRNGFAIWVAMGLLAACAIYAFNPLATQTVTYHKNQWLTIHENNWQHGDLNDLALDWIMRTTDGQSLTEHANIKFGDGSLSILNPPTATDLEFKQQTGNNIALSWMQDFSTSPAIHCYLTSNAGSATYRYTISHSDGTRRIELWRNAVAISDTQQQLNETDLRQSQILIRHVNGLLTLFVNQKEAHRYQDPLPLFDLHHCHIGLTFPALQNTTITQVSIKRQTLPEHVSSLSYAKHYLHSKQYDAALKQLTSFKAKNAGEQETAEFLIARCQAGLQNLSTSTKLFKHFILNHPQSTLLPYALRHYTLALCKQQQWDVCNDTLRAFHHKIESKRFRQSLHEELTRIIKKESTQSSPALSALNNTLKHIHQQ